MSDEFEKWHAIEYGQNAGVEKGNVIAEYERLAFNAGRELGRKEGLEKDTEYEVSITKKEITDS